MIERDSILYIPDGAGYVMLVDYMGKDLTTVNAAKGSFRRKSKSLGEKERGLIGFLANSDPAHTSPFRHKYVTLEVKAPIFVARQWWKHIVGAEYDDSESYKDTGWNEASGRYIAYDGYWTPVYFRLAPANKKQGSIDEIHPNNDKWLEQYRAYADAGTALYNAMVDDGVAPEQARALLGLNSYTSWYWTASFQAIAHFVNLRDHAEAQKEIQEYARLVETIMQALYPVTWQHRKALR